MSPSSASACLGAVGAYGMGRLAFREHRYELAIRRCQDAFAADPYSTSALGLWADCLRLLGRYEDADRRYQEVLFANSFEASAYVGQGRLHLLAGRANAAFALLRWACKLDPANLWARRSLAAALAKTGHQVEAIEHYRKALSINPWDVETLVRWGDALTQLAQPAEALAYFRRAVALDADLGWAWRRMVETLIDLGRTREAREEVERLAPSAENRADLLIELSGVLLRLQKVDASITAAQRARDLDADNPDALTALGAALREKARGRTRDLRRALLLESEGHLRLAVAAEPGGVLHRRQLAKTLLERDEPDKALAELDAALALDRLHSYTWEDVARTRRLLGDPAGAAAAYKRAIELRRDRVPLFVGLGETLWQLGEHRRAKFQLRRALAFDPANQHAADLLATWRNHPATKRSANP